MNTLYQAHTHTTHSLHDTHCHHMQLWHMRGTLHRPSAQCSIPTGQDISEGSLHQAKWQAWRFSQCLVKNVSSCTVSSPQALISNRRRCNQAQLVCSIPDSKDCGPQVICDIAACPSLACVSIFRYKVLYGTWWWLDVERILSCDYNGSTISSSAGLCTFE